MRARHAGVFFFQKQPVLYRAFPGKHLRPTATAGRRYAQASFWRFFMM